MSDLSFALLTFAAWLWPADPLTALLLLTVLGTALALLLVWAIAMAIDGGVRVVTDAQDDPATMGDHVEVPRVLPRGFR